MIRMLSGLVALTVSFTAWSCPVDINTASAEELQTLNGIGPGKAEAIIEYRKEHQFAEPEEITLVKGIGQATFDKNAECIAVQ